MVFGGTFDPVHVGHLIVARAAAESVEAPKVTLMPTRQPPHKSQRGASAEHRLAMLRAAIGDDPLFEASDLELRREGPSYTVDTLRQLHELWPDVEICWLIGLDMLQILHQWRDAAEVVERARIVTAVRPPRPGDLREQLAELRNAFGQERFEQLLADVIETPLIEVSSTEIRRRAGRDLPIDYLTLPAVVDYVHQHGLYRSDDPQ